MIFIEKTFKIGMKSVVIFIILFSFYSSFCQSADSVLYFDTSSNQLSKQEFDKKLSTKFFEVVEEKNDSSLFKKLKYIVFYGHIGFERKKELDKLFKEKYKIKNNSTWVIHYFDSIPNMENIRLSRKANNTDSLNSESREYARFRENLILSKRNYRKLYGAKLLNFYNYDKGYDLKLDRIDWFKDEDKILRKLFYNGVGPFKTIIIFRHGDFFALSYNLNFKGEKDHLNYEKFTRLREGYRKQLNKS